MCIGKTLHYVYVLLLSRSVQAMANDVGTHWAEEKVSYQQRHGHSRELGVGLSQPSDDAQDLKLHFA